MNTQTVEALLKKAEDTERSLDAVHFTQAALNAANALITMKHRELLK